MFKKLMDLLLIGVILLVIASISAARVMAQEKATNNKHGFIPEQTARRDATLVIMPSYPKDMVEQSVAGVVRTKIEIDATGNVIRATVQPNINPTLRKAVFDAIKKWTFAPRPAPVEAPDRTVISRLTFLFSIEDGEGRVKMFTPPQDAPPFEQLGGYDPKSEMREWQEWDTIKIPAK